MHFCRAEERRFLERQNETMKSLLEETTSALRDSQSEVLRLKELENQCEFLKSLTEVGWRSPPLLQLFPQGRASQEISD